MSGSRRPPWLLLERDQVVLYVLGVLLVVVAAARYGLARWGTAKDVRILEPGTPIAYRVDLNHAGGDELDLLPGIGPAKARRIVEDREANGPFRRVEDLARVSGITIVMVDELRDLVTVGPASEERELRE
ncbi:MAG: ComEA family DNA-binding protein [Planctomycetota bacterium]